MDTQHLLSENVYTSHLLHLKKIVAACCKKHTIPNYEVCQPTLDSLLLHESSLTGTRLWRTEPVDSFLACLTLLSINKWEIERAALVMVVSVCSVWCFIFDPSRIVLSKAKSEGDTASLWQSAWNDSSNGKIFSNIFLRATSTAHARCISSLS